MSHRSAITAASQWQLAISSERSRARTILGGHPQKHRPIQQASRKGEKPHGSYTTCIFLVSQGINQLKNVTAQKRAAATLGECSRTCHPRTALSLRRAAAAEHRCGRRWPPARLTGWRSRSGWGGRGPRAPTGARQRRCRGRRASTAAGAGGVAGRWSRRG